MVWVAFRGWGWLVVYGTIVGVVGRNGCGVIGVRL